MKATSQQNRAAFWVLGGAILFALILSCAPSKTASHSQSGYALNPVATHLLADGTESNGGGTKGGTKPPKLA